MFVFGPLSMSDALKQQWQCFLSQQVYPALFSFHFLKSTCESLVQMLTNRASMSAHAEVGFDEILLYVVGFVYCGLISSAEMLRLLMLLFIYTVHHGMFAFSDTVFNA